MRIPSCLCFSASLRSYRMAAVHQASDRKCARELALAQLFVSSVSAHPVFRAFRGTLVTRPAAMSNLTAKCALPPSAADNEVSLFGKHIQSSFI